MIAQNNLGDFASLTALWQAYPAGGNEGDYAHANGIRYEWNKYDRQWQRGDTFTESLGTRTHTIESDLWVGQNLYVGGTLFARDVQSASCGLFATPEELRSAIPSPKRGYYALVGDSDTAQLYLCREEGVWEDSGRSSQLNNISVDVATISEKINNAKRELTKVLDNQAKELGKVSKKAEEALGRREYTEAEQALVAKLKTDAGADKYLAGDGSYRSLPSYGISIETGEETKTATTYDIKLNDTEGQPISTASLSIPKSSGGSGAGFLNITREVPLQAGYHTLETALTALATLSVDEAERRGLIITFETSEGKWQEYRFVGQAVDDTTFLSAPMWQRYSAVDEAYINERFNRFEPTIQVAESVNDTNLPVASSAVKEVVEDLQNFTFDSDVLPTEDGSQVTLSHKGREVAQFVVSGGSSVQGGTQGTATSTKVTALLSQKRIKLGDKVNLTYGFTHSTEGEVDGTIATLSLIIKRGTQKVAEQALGTLTSGETATLDLTQYITSADTYSISVEARYEENGEPKQRTGYASLSVVNLGISLYNKATIEQAIARGGYRSGEIAPIVISVKGGAKELSLYIDGTLHETKTLSRSAGSQTFMLPIDTLSAGTHSLQFVATMEDLRSNSLYLDILKQGAEQPFIGLLLSNPLGTIYEAGTPPAVLAYQYEATTWDYIVYDPKQSTAELTMASPIGEQIIATPRSYQAYSTRFLSKGSQAFTYSVGSLTRQFAVEVEASTLTDIGIKEGAVLELLALGRSNVEAQPNTWGGGAITTTFTNVDFSSSGWHTSRVGQGATSVPCLRLLNGAKALVNYKPFATDIKGRGLTISFEAKIENIRRYEGAVVSCFDEEGLRSGSFAGFRMTASKIEMPLGGTQSFRSEEGEEIVRHLGLEMPTASGDYYAISLVIHPTSEEQTMRLYINGVLSKADTYQNDIFAQRTPQGILLDSTHADLEVRYLRVYETALSDDEVLNNYITDRPTLSEMQALRERNDVLGEDGGISYDKLRTRGKATTTITMEGGIERLWGKSVDTKTDHPFEELIHRSPYGKAYDLKVTKGIVRRQGTSTSTYPIKNLRIYLQKHKDTKVYRNIGTGDNDEWEVVEERTYKMRPDALPMKIINLKTDYADSSLCYNTGTAILLNDYLVRATPTLQNPAQRSNPSARMAIDGMPTTLFTNDTPEGKPRYCGQFQFNNDKSKSGYLFGQTKKDGTEIALEFINNTNPVANFAIEGDVAEQLARKGTEGFDDSVEFLYPEKDYLWNGKTSEKTAPDNIKRAVIRLWQFIKDCTPRGVDPSTMTEREVRTAFVSEKFKREVGQYFDVRNLTLWWVLTDYHMSVDQRVKNTFFRTWDGLKWWLTYYDGDTAFGKRNDAFLAYDYNINRDTRDLQRNKFAFEGHNSRLWCLVIANLEEELKASAKLLRQSLTNKVYLDVFNRQIMGAWSEREYNKSGIYKYIKPTYTDYHGGGTMNYIFALNGTMEAFRNQLLTRRFSMLDARYLVGQYENDAITGYIGKPRAVAGSLGNAEQIRITAGDEYYFGWKTQNGKLTDYQHALLGGEAVFSYPDAMSQNDPIRLIGASRVRKIDFATTAPYLQGAWNFNTCKQLEEVVARVEQGTASPWFAQLRGISGLRRIDLTGQSGVSGTEGAGSTDFDVSTHSGLRELLLGGTAVRSVRIAGGSPITRLVLPPTLTSLRLVALPELRPDGLTLEDWTSVRTLHLAGCPHFDWQALVARCTSLERLRVEGVDFTDDGTLLERFARLGGLTASGEGTDTCQLVGRCQLTKYLDEDIIARYRQKFPSLAIRQPQYTMIEFCEGDRGSIVLDSANISNLDNETGYKYGKPYQPSAHINKILSERFACLGKQEVKGQMKICPLSNENWAKYHSGEPAQTDLSEGDVFIYEPEYYYKGINDVVNKKKYACFASSGQAPDPSPALTIDLNAGGSTRLLSITRGYVSTIGASTLASALSADRDFTAYKVLLTSADRKVRFPSCYGDSLRGALFADEGERVLKTCSVPNDGLWMQGTYLIQDIPQGAKYLLFCVRTAQPYDPYVVLSPTERIEDLEPEWVHHKPCLMGAFLSATLNSKFGSGASQSSTTYPTAGISLRQARQAAEVRGLVVEPYDVRKDIVQLYFAKYGTRDTATGWNRPGSYSGFSIPYGMQDSKRASNGEASFERVNGDIIDTITVGQAKVMGYENFGGGSYWEVVDGMIYNTPRQGTGRITRPNGEQVELKHPDVGTTSRNDLATLHHGRYMDIVPATWDSRGHRYHLNFYITDESRYPVVSGSAPFNLAGTYPWSSAHETNTHKTFAYRLAYLGEIELLRDVEQFKNLANNF